MRILLIDCLARGSGGRKATVDVIGVGPRVIAGILEREGYSYKILTFEDFKLMPKTAKRYDILFVSGMTVDKPAVLNSLNIWRKFNNGISVLGGPITFGLKRDRSLYSFDVLVWGEAERTLPKVLEAISNGLDYDVLSEISGVAFKDERGKRVFNEPKPTTWISREELDNNPPSVKAVLHYDNYWALRVYVEVVRGCSNFRRPTLQLPDGKACTKCNICSKGDLEDRLNCPVGIPPGCGYCSIPYLYGPPRSRSVDRIYEEVKKLIDLGVSRIVLSGPDILDYGRDWIVHPKPLTDPEHPPANINALKSLLSKLTRISEVEAGEVSILLENIKANLVSEEVAKLLGEHLKGSPVHIGCETGCEEHALRIGRPTTPRDVIKAVEILKKYGLRPYVYFIHGLPGQNWHTVRETVKVVKRLGEIGVEKITAYRFKPLPETAFQDYPPGKPYVHDVRSKVIVDAVKEVNVKAKNMVKGKTIRCIVVRPSVRMDKDAIGYPLYHGPVVRIANGLKYVGFLVDTRITDVLSDRVVRGDIVKVLRRVDRKSRRF